MVFKSPVFWLCQNNVRSTRCYGIDIPLARFIENDFRHTLPSILEKREVRLVGSHWHEKENWNHLQKAPKIYWHFVNWEFWLWQFDSFISHLCFQSSSVPQRTWLISPLAFIQIHVHRFMWASYPKIYQHEEQEYDHQKHRKKNNDQRYLINARWDTQI